MMAEVSAMQESAEGIVSLGTRGGVEMAILGRKHEIRCAPIAKRDILPTVVLNARVAANGKRK